MKSRANRPGFRGNSGSIQDWEPETRLGGGGRAPGSKLKCLALRLASLFFAQTLLSPAE